MIVAVVLGVAEIIVPGVFLIWVAAAAAITALVTLIAGPPVALQFTIFAGLALIATWGGKRWYVRHPVPSADPLLNDRAARLVGETVEITSAIVNGRGRARVGDSEWNVRGPDAPAGSCLRVIGVEDGALVVRQPSTLPDRAGSISES
ncbi:NfeD family protein [Sphingomonas sp. ID1715]|nr:NfeD family protein [Sphingomonas sp. ID1715]NNM77655.1 NfeD family protein [Sphingomonas sp. ID1715]